MFEWIRFFLTAVLLLAGLLSYFSEVVGVFRFGFVMNRMHAAGVGDTMGLFFVALSLMISSGTFMDFLKMALIVIFMWITSPVSTHFVAQIEYYTNRRLYDHLERRDSDGNH